ncbi:kinase-like protein [Trametopsis cervina]|nr:kinase-like protein [Trametopsis cervina]
MVQLALLRKFAKLAHVLQQQLRDFVPRELVARLVLERRTEGGDDHVSSTCLSRRPSPLRTTSLTTMANPMHIKRVTLTSKKNWWMVELDGIDEEQPPETSQTKPYSTQETAVNEPPHIVRTSSFPHRSTTKTYTSTPHSSSPIYRPSTNPASIFSFPTPTSYSAPPNPTQNLAPFATGSASEVFQCVVKKPNVVQLEINGEMLSNAPDVTTQFLAELRVYTTVTRHRNIAAFLGSLENVGMVLEYIEGRTLWDVISKEPELMTRKQKIDFHNQLLDGLTHLHSFGLSHGDLSLLNIQVTRPFNTIKLLDFGRSVSADSTYVAPDENLEPPPPPPPMRMNSRFGSSAPIPVPLSHSLNRKVEKIHPGTRPFCAPEVLRGECQDALLADAYSFGMILVCLDRATSVDVKPWEQRKDSLPKGFLDGLVVFGERCAEYLRRWDQGRRRLCSEDMLDEDVRMEL